MRLVGSLAVALMMILLLGSMPFAAPTAQAAPFCDQGEAVHGRLFPDPEVVTDFIQFTDGECGLMTLQDRYPDLIEVKKIGESVGWQNLFTQSHDRLPVYAVELTDQSVEEKRGSLVFIVSVHGNEKGAREGLLRAIEDLLIEDGMYDRVSEATGVSVSEVLKELRLVFVFVNPDGWAHAMPEYRFTGTAATGFIRQNANGTDLNRQYPTIGNPWPTPPMVEPEVRAAVEYYESLPEPVIAGVDLHGMLVEDHLAFLMLKENQRDPMRVIQDETLSIATAGMMQQNDIYDQWRTAIGPEAIWGNTFDLLGYASPQTGGGYIVQETGLNAPGFTVELSLNHMAFDEYPGPGMYMNRLHVDAHKDILLGFLEYAYNVPEQLGIVGESHVGVLPHPGVREGARFNGEDADPIAAFDALAPYLVSATVERTNQNASWDAYTHLVVPHEAEVDLEKIKAWVEAGGTLVLTDGALQYAVDLGVANNLHSGTGVTGGVHSTNVGHALLAGTYDPVESFVEANTLGYQSGSVPTHCVSGFQGSSAGTRNVGGQEGCVVAGEATLGDGKARIMGAALPPPTEPRGDYGVDGYALTPNGYRVLLNMVDLSFDPDTAPPEADPEGDAPEPASVPAVGIVLVAFTLATVLGILRRKQ